MASDTPPPPSGGQTFKKGGIFGAFFEFTGVDPNVYAIMSGDQWTASRDVATPPKTVKYSFPLSAADYTKDDPTYSGFDNVRFVETTPEQQSATAIALSMVASYTLVTFEVSDLVSANDVALRIGGNSLPRAASYGSYPGNYDRSGDSFLASNGDVSGNFWGSDGFETIMHELGHTLGLKHGHEASPNGALAPQFNDNEFSLMTYASYLGGPTGGPTIIPAVAGSSPQSYMMFDIAALQTYYGANFSQENKQAVYRWDAVTGQQTINGVNAPNTGASPTGKIFTTVWTQGAISTYDLSNFHENQVDDLRPGKWLTFAHDRLADLNSQAVPGTPQYLAQGNVYNALLYNNDPRSLVHNLKTGNGNDKIIGNDADNALDAGVGNDSIWAGAGNDIITGGPGADTIDPGTGFDILRDTLVNMNGDTVFNFGRATTIDIVGTLAGRDQLAVSHFGGTTTLSIGQTAILLEGAYSDGAFMAAARVGADGLHTEIAFAPFLPTLFEGVPVAPTAINGIANASFLRGDGLVKFTATLEAAMSSFGNAVGAYRIADNGATSGVHLLFADTHAPGALQTTLQLGTPAGGESLAFFLVQNAAGTLGALPDDLSFATVDGHLVLTSASLGPLTGAAVFHSVQSLNPNGAIQVLSGVTTDGKDLKIGFEDLPNGQGDNDFQDVVLRIHTNRNDVLLG